MRSRLLSAVKECGDRGQRRTGGTVLREPAQFGAETAPFRPSTDTLPMKILVVEDSSSMRAYLTTVIESGDHPVELDIVEAASGFEALKMLPHHRFDAILTDINMPDINGLELVSFLKSHPVYKAIPIMVISTEASDEDRRRAAALGAEEYLVKPFRAADLLEKLQRLLKVA